MTGKTNSPQDFFKQVFRNWLYLTVVLFALTSLISIKFPLTIKPIKGFEILIGYPWVFYASEIGSPWPGGFYRKMFLIEFYLADLAFWFVVSFFIVWIIYGKSKWWKRNEKI